MTYTIREIADALGARTEGDDTLPVTGVAEPAEAGTSDLALAMAPKYAEGLAKGQARAAVLWDGADWRALGLAAAIPITWSPLQVYFIITLIVSLFGWTGLAREVRGRFFALRSEDFVTAARLDGSRERRLIFRHILPSLTSHILAVVTLALPTMIVAETALSFLGIGLKAPVVSWGVLLQDAQNVRTIATAPWLLIWPAGAVVIAVLSFNFLGDGMRDAADPYES